MPSPMSSTKRLRVHLLHPDAKAPAYAHPDDSGMDVFSIEEVVVHPVSRHLVLNTYSVVRIKTGLSFEIPEGYEIQVRSKSGLAAKHGLWVLNSPGTIDEGYRGELEIIMANVGNEPYTVEVGQKIAQIVLAPVTKAEVVVMNEGQRNAGGFGSTGA